MSMTDRRPRARLSRVRVVVATTVALLGLGVLGSAPAWAHDWTLTAPSFTATEGTRFSGVVSCIEPSGGGGTYSPGDFEATIDWGDGTQTAGTVVADFDSFCFLDVRGTHTYALGGSYHVFVSVEDLTNDGHMGRGRGQSVSVAVAPNDLGVGLGATPNPVRTSKNITYSLTVVNGSSNIASDVRSTLTLPKQTQFLGLSASAGSCVAPPVGHTGTVTCQIGALSADAAWTLTATAKVVAAGGTAIEATAEASGTDPDPFGANNTATVSTSVFGRR